MEHCGVPPQGREQVTSCTCQRASALRHQSGGAVHANDKSSNLCTTAAGICPSSTNTSLQCPGRVCRPAKFILEQPGIDRSAAWHTRHDLCHKVEAGAGDSCPVVRHNVFVPQHAQILHLQHSASMSSSQTTAPGSLANGSVHASAIGKASQHNEGMVLQHASSR